MVFDGSGKKKITIRVQQQSEPDLLATKRRESVQQEGHVMMSKFNEVTVRPR